MEKEYSWKLKIKKIGQPYEVFTLSPSDEVFLVKESSEETQLFPPVKPQKNRGK